MKNSNSMRWVAVAVIVIAAFAGAYAYGQARGPATVSSSALAEAQASGYVDPAAAAQQAAAVAQQNAAAQGSQPAATGSGSCCGGSSSSAVGGSCCGSGKPTAGGVTGSQDAAAAQRSGAVQRITVDSSSGTYAPNVVKLKAGVPAEITFTQTSGCTAIVASEDMNFRVDTSNGPQTVKLPALAKGTYGFHCGMNMVFGKVVVE